MKKYFHNLYKDKQSLMVVLSLAILTALIGFLAIKFYAIILVILVVLLPYFMELGVKLMGKNKKGKKEKPIATVKTEKVKTKKGKKDQKKKSSKKRKWLNIILWIILVGTVLVMSAAIAFSMYIVRTSPKFDPDALYRQESTIIYFADGEIMAKIGREKREKITYQDLPEVLVNAIVATEDSRFFEHNGFDLPRFIKATLGQAAGSSGAGGASTLSMQVIKNNFTDAKADRGLKGIARKFTDIYMSIFQLENKYSKQEIIEIYVNTPYLGSGAYGVEQASQIYFGKSVKHLSLPEAAMIAGLFKSPNYYDPYRNPENTEARRKTVLYLMERHGYITKEEEAAALSVSIESMLVGANSSTEKYQGLIDTAVQEIIDRTEKNPYDVPMKIYTTFDKSKQDYVDNVVANFNFPNEQTQTGIAVIDTQTSAIIAVGTGRYRSDKLLGFNYATMIDRQPGSTAKPIFDYGPGFEYNNWSTATPFVDEPYTYSNNKSIYNWDNRYNGLITLKQALGDSRNIPALKAFQQVKNTDIVSFVKSLGIRAEISDGHVHEAHSIGAFNGASPLEMAGAYAAFGNGGYYTKPYSVTKIEYRNDGTVVDMANEKVRVMKDSTAYLVTEVLKWSVDSGMSSGMRIPNVNIAAKTGTTNFDDKTKNDYRLPNNAVNDYWVIGYSPEYSIGMWFGYDKISNEFYNNNGSHSTVKNNLFKEIARGIIPSYNQNFVRPASVTTVEVELETYPIARPSACTPDTMRTSALFIKGTEPTETSARYAQLPSISGLNSSISGRKITLTWNRIDSPNFFNAEFISKYLNNDVYKRSRDRYLANRLEYNANVLGILGYNVYMKRSEGLVHLGFTTDNTFVYNNNSSLPDITFVVKAAPQYYICMESSPAEHRVQYSGSVNLIEMVLVGPANMTVVQNTTFTDPGAKVLQNFIEISETITKTYTFNGSNTASISTANIGTYKIKYSATKNGETITAERTVEVTAP